MLHTHISQDIYTIDILYDVHHGNSNLLEGQLASFKVPPHVNKLRIDLSHVNFIDSTGISFLVRWLYPLSSQLSIEFKGTKEPVKRILAICKIDQFVRIR